MLLSILSAENTVENAKATLQVNVTYTELNYFCHSSRWHRATFKCVYSDLMTPDSIRTLTGSSRIIRLKPNSKYAVTIANGCTELTFWITPW